MEIWFKNLVHMGVLMVGESVSTLTHCLGFPYQGWHQPSGCKHEEVWEIYPSLDAHTSSGALPGHLCPIGVFLGTLYTIVFSKSSTQEDSHSLCSMGASRFQSLHDPVSEFYLPKVMGLVEVCSIIFHVGDPTSQKVRSTRMTIHCKGLPCPEAIWPFLQTPCLTVLPGEGGAAEKVE